MFDTFPEFTQNPLFIAAIVIVLILRLAASALSKRAPKGRANVTDPKVQLACVKRVDFRPRALLNRSETAVFNALATALAQHRPDWRLMAQTSLGEIVEPSPRSGTRAELDNARRSINSKRVDFAVFGSDHTLQIVVEYHGSGHYRGNAKARDAVKREVFRRASIPLIELPAKATPQFIEDALLGALADTSP